MLSDLGGRPLAGAGWLAEHREEVVVADVRWYLDGRSGRDAFRAGHVPGARWIDLETVLAAPPSPAAGRHPLPDPDAFAAGLAQAGIGDADAVVAYDDGGGGAARLVWLLRAIGRPAALLDGGIAAWDGALETGDGAAVAPGRRTVVAWPQALLASADEVADAPLVIDARATERYAGVVEPIDPRAGHVPGAVNVPFASTLDEHGRFRGPPALRKRFADAGVGPEAEPIVYCGSGVTACHVLLALEAAGLPSGRLYAGSWSQWSNDPDRPAATGSLSG